MIFENENVEEVWSWQSLKLKKLSVEDVWNWGSWGLWSLKLKKLEVYKVQSLISLKSRNSKVEGDWSGRNLKLEKFEIKEP